MGQCVVSNRPDENANLPSPPPGKYSFDGSLSQLDVPITGYDWQVYSTDGNYFGGGVTTISPKMTYNFSGADPSFFSGKRYTVCLRLVYDTETYGERCMERTADIEPFRSCLTLLIQ